MMKYKSIYDKNKVNKVIAKIIGSYNKTFINSNEYEISDRIGQLIIIPYPQIEFEEVEELSETERGIGGYGSTGS